MSEQSGARASAEDQAHAGPNRYTVALMAGCVALGVLTLVLSHQNRELQKRLQRYESVATNPAIALREGDSLAGVELLDATAQRRPLVDPEKDWTLVYVFARGCESCKVAGPLWREATHAVPASVDRLSISLDQFDFAEFDAFKTLDAPVYTAMQPRGPLSRIGAIPAAVLVTRDGTIQRIWTSLADRRAIADLQTTLGRLNAAAGAGAEEAIGVER